MLQQYVSSGDLACGVVRRNKDDLHEWSIYRQNLTSSLATSVLNLASANEYKVGTLPFGNFHMNKEAVKGVIKAGRLEENQLSQKADTYLKFGLPRMAIHGQSIGDYTLQTIIPLRRSETMFGNRKCRSEWDLSNNKNSMADDVCMIEMECATLNDDALPSGVSSRTTHFNQSDLCSSLRANRQNSFLQSARHHAQYFSNLDLFQQPSGFNYLRYAKADELRQESNSKQLNVSISNLTFSTDRRSYIDKLLFRSANSQPTLSDISLKLFGGEIIALLYTTESEMRALLHVLAQKLVPNGEVSGVFEFDGNRLNAHQFGERIALVDNDELCPHLTVKQTLRISVDIIQPATDAFEVDDMIDQLIQTLALGSYRNLLCKELGESEKQRLKIAEQVLKDTGVLLCNNVTKDMDLYDTAFIIDYLRDWAIKLNRIVIMAIAPQTIEILHMFHKTVLMASGRIIYSGHSNEMINYFESINFPCPMLKNPCDYYVDLVTQDHLTPEASIESTERIKHLADLWQGDEPVTAAAAFNGRLVSYEAISPKLRHANCLKIPFIMYRRFLYMLLNRPLFYVKEVLLSMLISVIMGVIFFEIPADRRSSINDRYGFILSVLSIFLLPNLLITVNSVHNDRMFLYNDVRRRYYDPSWYLFVKMLFDLPIAILSYTAYSLPAYLLTDLPPADCFWSFVIVFVVIVIIYCILWRYIAWAFTFLFRSRFWAAIAIVSWMICCMFGSGILVHPNDLSSRIAKHFLSMNPTRMAAQIMAENELRLKSSLVSKMIELTTSSGHGRNVTEIVIGCERKKILASNIMEVPIYMVAQCPKIRGTQAFHFAGFRSENQYGERTLALVVRNILLWYTFVFVVLLLLIRINHRPIGVSYDAL